MRDAARVSDDGIPERKGPGTRIRTLAQSPMLMLDIHMATRSSFVQEVPTGQDGFIYVLAGSVTVGTTVLQEGQLGRLEAGDGSLRIQAGPVGGRAVLCAGAREVSAT